MPDSTLVTQVVQQVQESFGVQFAKLCLFIVFISAVVEVIKNISTRGLYTMVKELVLTLAKNTPLSTETMKMLNFVVALVYLRVFNYGVMIGLLGIKVTSPLAWWLDYLGTASVLFMGADWLFVQYKSWKDKVSNVTAKP